LVKIGADFTEKYPKVTPGVVFYGPPSSKGCMGENAINMSRITAFYQGMEENIESS